jgi:hypothetical protein
VPQRLRRQDRLPSGTAGIEEADGELAEGVLVISDLLAYGFEKYYEGHLTDDKWCLSKPCVGGQRGKH